MLATVILLGKVDLLLMRMVTVVTVMPVLVRIVSMTLLLIMGWRKEVMVL